MSSLIRKFYKSGIAWDFYKKKILNDFCVPCYHVVSNSPQAHIKNLFPIIDEKKFEKDIDFFLKNFDFITPIELLESLDKNEIPKNKFILTFDDGYKECYDIIYPILKRKGIPAIFFIIRDLVDNINFGHFNKISLIIEKLRLNSFDNIVTSILIENSLYTGNIYLDIRKLGFCNSEIIDLLGIELGLDFDSYLHEIKPYLTAEQIREMYSNGFSIGAHSNNHQRFVELNKDQQLLQVQESIEFIKLITNEPTRFFAFPYSSNGFKSELYKGFSNIVFFDTFRGFQKSNCNIIQRIVTDSFDNIDNKLVEIKLKKLSYKVRFKNIPNPSFLE